MTKLGKLTRRALALPIVLAAAGGLIALSPRPAMAAANGWELAAMSVPAAQKITKGEGVTVAVIDTGIRTNHEALKGRATAGPDFLGETDQNESYYGRHGTAMASDVLDVAPEAKVLGLRAIRDDGDPKFKEWSSTLDEDKGAAATAVHRAIRAAVDSGAKVISMSLGTITSLGAYDSDEAAAIAYAVSKGVVVIASAGNEGDGGNELSYPAAYPGVIAVGASKPDGKRAGFSQVHTYVDVAAPGVEIYAADIHGGRRKIQGTSPAGALIAGVAALIKSKYPDLTPRQVEQLLEKTASTYAKGYNPQTGYGVINAEAALKAAANLKAESAGLPVGTEGAGGHFGSGDDGTPRVIGQPLDTSYLVVGGISGGMALFGIAIGLMLFIMGRRAAARSRPPVLAPL
jgi:subtilisin family serine protease